MDRCGSCQYVYAEVALDDAVAAIRSLPGDYGPLLRGAEADGLARTRPEPTTWSALEYTCHVRDVLRIQRERLLLALQEERPVFAPMRRDERAVEERYNEQDVEGVLDELAEASERFAARLEALDEAGWRRVGVYNWPETAERSMAWLARHTLHEGHHHLRDVINGVDALRGTD
jgi:hypothetical protein